MCVAALLDLGVPLDHLNSELAKLSLPVGSYSLSTVRTERQHLPALQFCVEVHDHHSHRRYADIDLLIATSSLGEAVKQRARQIFRILAEAEAHVHQVAVADVHFHEVGAIDSIVDIVGATICLNFLGVDMIAASPLPMGSGFVETAHGRLPVPAPATAELLRGLAVHNRCGSGERVTPTGAAIVAALASSVTEQPIMRLIKSGSGAGGKEFQDCPNILRAFLGETIAENRHDDILIVESNIDDSTPEVLGYTMEQLFQHGALDVFYTPIQMKKNRPATLLSFLCASDHLEKLTQLVLHETSAIGVRYYPASRIKLPRSSRTYDTLYGPVLFKVVSGDDGSVLRAIPEYDDCRRIAIERSIPCREVMERLTNYHTLCDAALTP
jgi:uncharacterized protein (TIGR00299 family) protein